MGHPVLDVGVYRGDLCLWGPGLVAVDCCSTVFGLFGVFDFYGDEEWAFWVWWWRCCGRWGRSGHGGGEQETEENGEEGWTEDAVSVRGLGWVIEEGCITSTRGRVR